MSENEETMTVSKQDLINFIKYHHPPKSELKLDLKAMEKKIESYKTRQSVRYNAHLLLLNMSGLEIPRWRTSMKLRDEKNHVGQERCDKSIKPVRWVCSRHRYVVKRSKYNSNIKPCHSHWHLGENPVVTGSTMPPKLS